MNAVTSIATIDNNYVCATLDWWPANKCNYNDCPWGQTGILNLDLSNKVLSNAIKAFNPLRFRLGGSVEDQIVYQFGKQKKCPHFKKREGSVTHHIYNLGAGVDKDVINKIQDPYFLSQVAETFKNVAQAVKEFTPWAAPWVGEAGGAYNSGSKDVSHTFVNGFWYLDQLGMTSTLNHKVYCRQTLVGGNYGLLNTTSFIPNPDYYGALLWHRLMGSKVLSVSHEGSPFLRAYAHCSKKGPGIIVLLINMSNSTAFNVSLVDDMNLDPVLETIPGKVPTTTGEEYHLTPKDGNIRSDVVLMNGTPLQLKNSLDIPEMKPWLVDASSPIKAEPNSNIFVYTKSVNAPTC
uniref:Heparanase-like protein 2 n=1 Tax=Cajanus cajan TaxID=3821 RepID=A0A151UHP3_CAJCA